ncbi:hypothetical protein GCM10023159_18220 [Brevibacterium yomogidense]
MVANESSDSIIHTLQAQANSLPVGDWEAHRDLAQVAVENGLAAQVEQTFSNDASDPEPLTHRTTVHPADTPALGSQPVEHTEEGPMGDTVSTETFTPQNPTGYFGARTPWEDSPNPGPDSSGPPLREAPRRDQYAETVNTRNRLFTGMTTNTPTAKPTAEFQQRHRIQQQTPADGGRERGQ